MPSWRPPLQQAGRELFRQLMQDHLKLRAQREQRLQEVIDAGQVARGALEAGHTRALTTVFGEVTVTRQAYRRRGHANLYPADAALNLPVEKHSHGLRQLAAPEAARGSFDDTAEAIERATGVRLGKRQAEALAGRAAADVDDFDAQPLLPAGAGREVLVPSADGKGILMRPPCAPRRCARPPPKTQPRPPRSCPRGCPRARNATANAWPRSAPSTTPTRSCAPPPTSSPAARTRKQDTDPDRPRPRSRRTSG
jgi:hypothetical protein